MEFEKICFTGVLNCGAYIYGAEVYVRKGAGMGEIVRAIKAEGYKKFMLPSMRVLASV